MSVYYFPDNTVLVNFASVQESSLLVAILDGRGRWTDAVADEARKSRRHHPDLGILIDSGALGEELYVDDPADVRAVEHLRRQVFHGPIDKPTKHLGEATTCFLLRKHEELRESFWVTDDRDAAEYAKRQGIFTWGTSDLMSEGLARGACVRDDAWLMLLAMRKAGNYLWIPASKHQL